MGQYAQSRPFPSSQLRRFPVRRDTVPERAVVGADVVVFHHVDIDIDVHVDINTHIGFNHDRPGRRPKEAARLVGGTLRNRAQPRSVREFSTEGPEGHRSAVGLRKAEPVDHVGGLCTPECRTIIDDSGGSDHNHNGVDPKHIAGPLHQRRRLIDHADTHVPGPGAIVHARPRRRSSRQRQQRQQRRPRQRPRPEALGGSARLRSPRRSAVRGERSDGLLAPGTGLPDRVQVPPDEWGWGATMWLGCDAMATC